MNDINQTPLPNPEHTEEEIDLIALSKTAWNGRRIVIKTAIIFFIIGLFIAIFSPSQYSVTATMVPQTSQKNSKLGGLTSLAAMAGFNLDMNTGSELSPVIYPQIVQSIPFKKDLLQSKITFEKIEGSISLYDYFTKKEYKNFNLIGAIKKYTIGLPGVIIKLIKGEKETESPLTQSKQDKMLSLSPIEYSILKNMDGMVYLNVNELEGYITLTAIMPEARATAQLGQHALNLLQEYITKYKIEKAEAQLTFIQERYEATKLEFEKAQLNLAKFRDQNKFVSTAMAKTEEERLQSEYQIAQSVYTELAKQLEKAKIQVKEETPVLTVIEPIAVPNERFKPKRKQIVLTWIFLGIFIGIGWVFGKEFWLKIKEKWSSHKI